MDVELKVAEVSGTGPGADRTVAGQKLIARKLGLLLGSTSLVGNAHHQREDKAIMSWRRSISGRLRSRCEARRGSLLKEIGLDWRRRSLA